MRLRPLPLLVLAALPLAWFAAPARAQCPDPYRKAYEEGVTSPGSDVSVTRLNYHAEGSHVCITKPPAFCDTCTIGKAYTCRGGQWDETVDAACAKRARTGAAKGSPRSSGAAAPGFANTPAPAPRVAPGAAEPGSEPISGACSVLGTC